MFKQRAKTRGSALVNILMMSVVLTMLVSVIVASAAFLWNSSAFYRNKDDAKLMAKSLVNQAIYEIMEDDKWGESGTESILLKGDPWPGVAELHFRSGEKHSSVWNMAPDSSVVKGSLDNFVPEHSVQLVARAEVRGAKVTYEAVVRKKGLDYAIASSGPFRAAGRNEAAALDNLDDLRGLDLSAGVPQGELVKDDQARTTIATAFAPSGGNGMEFEGELVLHGDAISASGIDGLDNVTFENGGQATTGAVDVDIVDIDIQKYDPLGPDFTLDKDLVNKLNSTSYDNANLEGFFRWQGGGTLTGQTELKTGLLYVDGDLVINGGLTGTGAIICTGDILITGHADLSATSQVAILAEGDLKFRGTTKGQSLFTGLLYSEGALDIANLTLVGSAIANNKLDPEKASATVEEVTLVNSAEAAEFDLKFDVENPDIPPPSGGRYPRTIKDLNDAGFEILTPDSTDYLDADGNWNGTAVNLQVRYNNITYDSPSEIPNISDTVRFDAIDNFTNIERIWNAHLATFTGNEAQNVPLFQLDPNTILSKNSAPYVDMKRYHP